MAKKDDKVTLAGLTQSLKAGKMSMAPAIAAQIEAYSAEISAEQQAAPAAPQDTNLKKSMDGLTLSVNKLIRVIQENTKLWMTKSKPTTQSLSTADLSENELEAQRVQDYQTTLLEKIEENTRGLGHVEVKEEKKKKDEGFGLGKYGLILASISGVILGLLEGQWKAMKFFANGIIKIAQGLGNIVKFFYNLLPEAFRKAVARKITSIGTFFSDIGTKLMINVEYGMNVIRDFFRNKIASRFQGVIRYVENAVESITAFFSRVKTAITTNSKVIAAVNAIKSGFQSFIKPFVEAQKAITTTKTFTNIIEGISKYFDDVMKYFSKFGSAIKYISKKVAAIFYPIKIIMGIFDTITGAIEGYKKEGILGAISGAIKGLVNGVFMGFFDLIKDAVSWILDKLGFDSASKFLDSFSFVDLYTRFVDAVFHPIDTLKSIITKLTKWLATIEIPGFSIFGKKFGPWKPFAGMLGGSEGGESADTEGAKKAVPQTKSVEKTDTTGKATTKTRALTKEEERLMSDAAFDAEFGPVDGAPKIAQSPSTANKVYNQSSQNEAAKQVPVTQPKSTVISAPTQVNNQTQNSVFRNRVRNDDNTVNSYLKSRFAI